MSYERNAVGIDVSNGRSTVSVLRPFGEVVLLPFEVKHTTEELSALADKLTAINGETLGKSSTDQAIRQQLSAQCQNRQG